jgi:hypothetical protein
MRLNQFDERGSAGLALVPPLLAGRSVYHCKSLRRTLGNAPRACGGLFGPGLLALPGDGFSRPRTSDFNIPGRDEFSLADASRFGSALWEVPAGKPALRFAVGGVNLLSFGNCVAGVELAR